MKNKIKNILFDITINEILLFVSFTISFGIFYPLTYYVHEVGHIFFGIISNLIFFYSLCIPYISNWINIYGIPLPQQTKNCEGMGTLLFLLGGIVFVILITNLVIVIFSKKVSNKSKKYLHLILLIVSVQQLVNNYLFGTDNQLGSPILSREKFSIIFNNIDTVMILSLSFLIALILKREKGKIFIKMLKNKN